MKEVINHIIPWIIIYLGFAFYMILMEASITEKKIQKVAIEWIPITAIQLVVITATMILILIL